jgi:hypothetical protein
MNTKACFDELEKLGAVSDDQAQSALDRLDTLERQKATAGQVARYGALGAASGAAIGHVRNAISGSKNNLRTAAGNALAGAVSAGALPVLQKHLDRRAEEGTLKDYLKENEGKTAAPLVKAAPLKPPTLTTNPNTPAVTQPKNTVPPSAPSMPPPKPATSQATAPASGLPPVPVQSFKPPPMQSVTASVKLAFSTNSFSGPMNPNIDVGVSRQQGGPMPRADRGGSPAPGRGFEPTRGGFLLASGMQGPIGLHVKQAAVRILNGDHAQYLLDKERGDGVDCGKTKEKDSEVDMWPTWKDGDFKKAKLAFKLEGHTQHQGLEIAIENQKGSVRKGVGKDGKPWRTEMKHPYGYIKGSKGADGDEVDCYVGPDEEATHAHVVHQNKEDGKTYDEDKVMLGFSSKDEARKAYLDHYDDPKFLGPMVAVPVEKLKALIETGKKLMKISAALPGAKFKTPNVMGTSGTSIEQVAKPVGFGRIGAVPATAKGGF